MENDLTIYCDGGSRGNPGPAASAFVVKSNSGKVIAEQGIFLGKKTNNQAEYLAVVFSLKWLKEKSQKLPNKIFYCIDSLLVVNQLNGLYKIKNSDLRDLIIQIRQLENDTKKEIVYQYVPREKNTDADRLVNQTLDNQ